MGKTVLVSFAVIPTVPRHPFQLRNRDLALAHVEWGRYDFFRRFFRFALFSFPAVLKIARGGEVSMHARCRGFSYRKDGSSN